jgi:hypothetical protein
VSLPMNPTVGSFAGGCPCAPSGHAVAAPPMSVMNSRRLMGPLARRGSHPTTSLLECRAVHHSKIDRRMAEMGQKRKSSDGAHVFRFAPEKRPGRFGLYRPVHEVPAACMSSERAVPLHALRCYGQKMQKRQRLLSCNGCYGLERR